MIGKNYSYKPDPSGICYIYDSAGEFIGAVWIDKTGAWNPNYLEGVSYLPINSALRLLNYPGAENNTIE